MRTLARRVACSIVDRLSRRAFLAASTNIELGLQIRALEETCRYVAERMSQCAAFTSAREILDFAVEQSPREGFVCEFGVFKGGSINRLAQRLRPRTVHGFDSFEGLPESWRAGFERGTFRTEVPKVAKNVTLHKGWFENTLPEFRGSLPEPRAALLHIDCDLYSSAKVVFDCLGDTITAGTIVLFDEYFNYPNWREHEYRALQEFCQRTGRRYAYLAYNRRHEQVVIRFE